MIQVRAQAFLQEVEAKGVDLPHDVAKVGEVLLPSEEAEVFTAMYKVVGVEEGVEEEVEEEVEEGVEEEEDLYLKLTQKLDKLLLSIKFRYQFI